MTAGAALALVLACALASAAAVRATMALVGMERHLGRTCWLRTPDGWRKHRVVAVSHKGALCIRAWENRTGTAAYWVGHERVRELVRFRRPSDA